MSDRIASKKECLLIFRIIFVEKKGGGKSPPLIFLVYKELLINFLSRDISNL